MFNLRHLERFVEMPLGKIEWAPIEDSKLIQTSEPLLPSKKRVNLFELEMNNSLCKFDTTWEK
ncbi:hypothetical protein NEIG_01538 [Nematocida sp. ERTm5]|nr:hypothetical protein NEIRO02_1181 [Nematocida sp. AWRm79]KAI5182872.1 hypothetical protein NEIRO03_0512 [Nematocida sp. AWRm78]OAG32965.1 hypothetical protein NEIG_01538 [Nematocida sp. ERTm5]